MALGAVQCAVGTGLRVPDDLSVVGFDGIEATDWSQPALTTVAQPIAEIADTTVTALRTMIDEPSRPLPNFVFRPKLRSGGSTAPPPAQLKT